MREFVYLGDSADTHSNIEFDSYFAFSIEFSGFRDSTLRYVKPYLDQVFSFEPTDAKYFETVKEKTHRALSNYFLGDPYRLAYNLTTMATRHGLSVSPAEKLQLIDKITFQDIANFGKTWAKKLYVESYIAGNLDES